MSGGMTGLVCGMPSNVKLSCDEAETPTVIIHARCVPMPCRRSANLDVTGIPAAEGEGAVVGAADAEVLRQGAMVFHHCGGFPLDLEIRSGAQGPAALMWLAASLALSGRPALPGLPVRRGHARRNAGPEGPRDSGVTKTTVGGGGKIPGILGIFSMLIDILGIPGIFNIPVWISGATPSRFPSESSAMFPAPKTPIRFSSLGILQGIETRGGALRASRSFSPGNPADPPEHLGSRAVRTLPGYGFCLRLSLYRQSSTNLMN